jgi:hypothetical protein
MAFVSFWFIKKQNIVVIFLTFELLWTPVVYTTISKIKFYKTLKSNIAQLCVNSFLLTLIISNIMEYTHIANHIIFSKKYLPRTYRRNASGH